MMKRIVAIFPLLAAICSCGNVFDKESEPMVMEYQSSYWEIPEGKHVLASLEGDVVRDSLPAVKSLKDGFTFTFTASLQKTDSVKFLLEVPRVLTVCTYTHVSGQDRHQNYSPFPVSDGSVPVLEASLWLQDEWGNNRPLKVGMPLTLLEDPYGRHEVCLQFTGVAWSLIVDNRLYDNDFAIGYPRADFFTSWTAHGQAVEKANLYVPALALEHVADSACCQPFNIQFWTPPYHNAWVGDVATLYHKGRYHVFYLFDRRGHGSKFGKGGHYFEHLSTADFRHWVEHEAATPIEQQWESFGTGTPFVYGGKLCLSYGLHTTRIYPRERTSLPMQWYFFDANGHTGAFSYDTISHVVPAGSTYSVSEDGVSRFNKTHVLIHPCENPSIYVAEDGSLQMLANYGAKGMWQSDSVSGGWRCINETFPPGGDCTFPFHWNGYDYIIGGFSRLWYKKTADSTYTDMVSNGIDFYNGMSVPSIAEIPRGRFLMAAWMKTEAWGGPLVIHELVQRPDGTVGNKWMSEIVPATDDEVIVAKEVETGLCVDIPSQPFLLSFEVHSKQIGKGRFAVTFGNRQNKELSCEWQMKIPDEWAQFAPADTLAFAPLEKTLRQGGDVSTARNYAIENGMKFDGPFTVRMLVHPSAKVRGTLLDVEIGQQRTMLSYRPGLFADQMKFRLQDVQIKKVTISLLK